MTKNLKRQSGFTIIEVVLVLAVAGLIFLVVFAAIPRLQASRRDNQRKRDAEAIAAAVISYQSTTGSIPPWSLFNTAFEGGTTAGTGAFADFIANDNLVDPSGNFYEWQGATSGPDTPGLMYYNHSISECNSTGSGRSPTTGANDWILVMGLERGRYCIDGKG